jgi:VanZ family protein
MERSLSLLRVIAWLCVATIVVLSIVPGTHRPHVLPAPKLEHLAAYFVVGAVLVVGFLEQGRYILTGLCLTFLAGALEIAQLSIPGRESKLSDWAISSLGAWAGIGTVLFAVWALRHFAQSHQRRST